MKSLVICNDSSPTRIFDILVFPAFVKFCSSKGVPISVTTDILGIKNSTVLLDAVRLSPEKIRVLKTNDNMICSCDENDGATLNDGYSYTKEAKLIDLVFKMSGVQKEEKVGVFAFKNLKYKVDEANFPGWENFNYLKGMNRLVPLPHVPWYFTPLSTSFIPFEEKRKTCLVRGSLHHLRYHLFLWLAKFGFADKNCGFFTEPYHLESMIESRKFCEWCRKNFLDHGISYTDYKSHPKDCCRSLAKDWELGVYEGGTKWNCSCLPGYYWLTEQWQNKFGVFDMGIAEQAFNCRLLPVHEADKIIQQSLFYGDYKWHTTINLPQRHWQAVKEKTISLLPRHTNEHDYFPEAVDGKHYVTFSDTFEDIESVFEIKKEKYEYIAENSYQQYLKWIRATDFSVSTNLLEYILNCIEVGGKI